MLGMVGYIVAGALIGGIAGVTDSKIKEAQRKREIAEKAEIIDVANRWKNCLLNSGITHICDNKGNTFELYSITKTDYGYKAKTKSPSGSTSFVLESATTSLEDEFSGIVEVKKDRYEKHINVEIIIERPKFEYKPVKTKYDEMFIGYRANGKAYIIDIATNAHNLICGMTGTGKSFLMASILTNISYNWGNNVEFHLCQIKKGDISYFRDLKGTKFTSFSLKEIAYHLQKIDNLIDERTKKLDSAGNVRDIDQWNEFFPKKKMKRMIVVFEELSFFMPDENEKESEDEEYKKIIWSKIWSIAKSARAVGIHLLLITQRTTIKNIPSEVKSQMSTISFKQKSVIDSQNAVSTTDAVRLQKKDHEFIFDGSEYDTRIIAPTIDRQFKMLQKYVPEIIVPEKPIEFEECDITTKKQLLEAQTDNLREKREIIDMGGLTMDEYIAKIKTQPIQKPVSNKQKPKGSGIK